MNDKEIVSYFLLRIQRQLSKCVITESEACHKALDLVTHAKIDITPDQIEMIERIERDKGELDHCVARIVQAGMDLRESNKMLFIDILEQHTKGEENDGNTVQG